MKVNPNPKLQPEAAAQRQSKRVALDAAEAGTDFAASTKLTEKLAAAPEIRPNAVARAKALLADPNYPDHAVVNQVALKLANHLADSAPKS